MESVGHQVPLSFARAMRIALQGIRIRFGRSLVTVSGVVLGIAFLMSNLTGQLIQKAVATERSQRQTANLMLAAVQAEVGALAGKPIAVHVAGTLSAEEQALLRLLAPARLQQDTVEDALLLLVLGNAPSVSIPLAQLTAGLSQKVVLDSLGSRQYPGGLPAEVRRELFFGAELQQKAVEMEAQARQQAFRTRWIILVSLLVTVIGVSNALLMSVTERFREIGTMKCLGALSSFIRRLFLIESTVIGLAGSLIGTVSGATLSLVAYGFTYRFGLVFASLPVGGLLVAALGAILVGTILAVVAAIYPATFAARMVPASALRSTV